MTNKKIKFILFLLFFLVGNTMVLKAAAKDTTPPTISIKKSTTEATNQDISLKITVKDDDTVKTVKWLEGKKKVADFTSKGNKITLSKNTANLTISENGTYTIYAVDSSKNASVKVIKVSNIDKIKPTIKVTSNNSNFTNKNIKLTVTTTDKGLGIKSVKWLAGKKKAADFTNAGKELNLNNGVYTLTVKTNGNYTFLTTDNAGNKTIKTINISNIDTVSPNAMLSYTVMEQVANIQVVVSDNTGISNVLWQKGNINNAEDKSWLNSGKNITDKLSFNATSSGIYSVLVTDYANNKNISQIEITMEMKAVWITYLEYGSTAKTKNEFINMVDGMFDNCVNLGMNAVIVQVRPFADALYNSKYFPWSKYVSGYQGNNPGYDPLEYMVSAAHVRGLEIHAWLNPYRVTAALSSTGITDSQVLSQLLNNLSKDNPAKKWLTDNNTENDRNVLLYNKALYFNPASSEVQKLIINGVKEIVTNYDVDGIHFDDYFYPSLGTTPSKVFDYIEYEAYVFACNKSQKTPKNIADWRRDNVSTLVKNTYSAIKTIKPSVRFGISPAGNINNLTSNSSYFVDIKKWLSSSDYVDYICPQLYWGFEHKTAPFINKVEEWMSIKTSSTVNLYIGIAVYKGGATIDVQDGISEWATNTDILKRQIKYCRDTGIIDGFMFYRYESFYIKNTQKEITNLLEVLSNR